VSTKRHSPERNTVNESKTTNRESPLPDLRATPLQAMMASKQKNLNSRDPKSLRTIEGLKNQLNQLIGGALNMPSMPQRSKDLHLRNKTKHRTAVLNSIEQGPNDSPRNQPHYVSFQTIAASRDNS